MEEAECLFDAYAVVGAVMPLEATEETLGMWQDRAADLVDVCLIKESDETPEGYVALKRTPSGASAAFPAAEDDQELYLCVKRRGKESSLPAVTMMSVKGDSNGADATSSSSSKRDISWFVGRRRTRQVEEVGANWKVIERTHNGEASARLKVGGFLSIRFARPEDARREPLLDVCVASELPKGGGFEEEAVIAKHYGVSAAKVVYARRGALCGARDVTWRASVLDRYPEPAKDDNDCSFEWDVLPMLAWPHGLRLERAPASSPPPVRYVPYALSGDPRCPTYVASLVFYEPLPLDQRKRALNMSGETSDDHEGRRRSSYEAPELLLYAPKCVCLLTRCAGVADGARRWLAALYTLALSALEIPLEHVVAHAVGRVPAPCRGGAPLSMRVNPSLPPIQVKLVREPPDAELPPLGASSTIRSLFACFEPQDAVAAFSAALLERRLLLVSKRAALVSDVAEALRALLFPLRWEGVYVPRLALPILETLDFPGAILAGVDAGDRGQRLAECAVEKARESGGYVILFLDEGHIEYDDGGFFYSSSSSSKLPENLASQLAKRWAKVADVAGVGPRDRDRAVAEEVFDNAPAPSALRFNKRRANNKTFYDSSDDDLDDCGPPEWTSGCERAARDAALTAVVSLLDGYSDHLVVPHVDYYSVSSASLFNEEEFFKDSKSSAAVQSFRRRLARTQSWSRFIQRRVETSDADLVLFDECVSAFRDATEAHRKAIIRGDALLLDSVDAAHHMKRLLAKTTSDSPRDAKGNSSGESRKARSERVSWHMRSSRWRDEQLLQTALAREAGCTYGSDARGRPRIEVPPPPPLVQQQQEAQNGQKKHASAKRYYSYFVLGRGLRWPCPLDKSLFPVDEAAAAERGARKQQRMLMRKPTRMRTGSAESVSTRTLARSQAELLLDMGLSVAGLRLGGGKSAISPTASGKWRDKSLVDGRDPARATAARQLLHAYGSWFLFAPSLVKLFTTEARYVRANRGLCGATAPMLVALGVLDCVLEAPCEPDEAIFRALLVAAGRSGTACKPIVANLFTQLRSKGIRPNALTFGQYTRAIAQRDFHSQTSSDSYRDYEESTLLKDIGDDILGGTSVADLLQAGLNKHLRLSGLGGVVRIVANLKKPMGIIFEERKPPHKGVFVKSLNEGSPAAENNTIKCGDILVAIDDTPCRESDFDACIELIRLSTATTTELVFERARIVNRLENDDRIAPAETALSPGSRDRAPEKMEHASVPALASQESIEEAAEDDENVEAFVEGDTATDCSDDSAQAKGSVSTSADGDTKGVVGVADYAADEDRTGDDDGPSDQLEESSDSSSVSLANQEASDEDETANVHDNDEQTLSSNEAMSEGHNSPVDAKSTNAPASECFEQQHNPPDDGEPATSNGEALNGEVLKEDQKSPKNGEALILNGGSLNSDTKSSVDEAEKANGASHQNDAESPTSSSVVEEVVHTKNGGARPSDEAKAKTEASKASTESKDSSGSSTATPKKSSSGSRVSYFAPSLAKAAAVFSGVTKASTVHAAKAFGGAAYDKAAKRLAALVDEAEASVNVVDGIEPGEPRQSARVSACLADILSGSDDESLEQEGDFMGKRRPCVAVIWSGCASPHHPREPPLDENIMAAWPEELGQREVSCAFTSRPYEPQLAYSVLEAVEAPVDEQGDDDDDDEIWVRLWRPKWPRISRDDGGDSSGSEEDQGSNRHLVSEHPPALSISHDGISIGPIGESSTDDTPVRLSTLLRAAGIDRDVSTRESSSFGSSGDDDEDELPGGNETPLGAERRRANCELSEGVARCAYLSPLQLRYDLELQVQRHGEQALEGKLLALENPALFWSLWWYCARLDIPFPVLPTPSSAKTTHRRRKDLDNVPFAVPRVAVVSWSRRGALAGGAAALRSILGQESASSVSAAAAEALKLGPESARVLLPARESLLGGSAASTRVAFTRASPQERLRDACALYLEARSSAAERGENRSTAFSDDMYRTLLRLNEPRVDGYIATTGPRVPKHPVEEAASMSVFDLSYRESIAQLHRDGADGLQARDESPSERAVVFRSIFGHLF